MILDDFLILFKLLYLEGYWIHVEFTLTCGDLNLLRRLEYLGEVLEMTTQPQFELVDLLVGSLYDYLLSIEWLQLSIFIFNSLLNLDDLILSLDSI